MSIMQIPLHQLVPHPNLPAGMNPLVINAVAHTLRNGHDAGFGPCLTEPILVSRGPDGRYVIEDGRHRWMAHWIAGLGSARCEVLDYAQAAA